MVAARQWLYLLLGAPPFVGYQPTLRRWLNLVLDRLEHRWVRTTLWLPPIKLVVEPTNACNLRCPCCFTGAGGKGRAASAMSMTLYRVLLDE